MKQEIEQLVELIEKASFSYYNLGKAIVTDADFDFAVKKLKTLDPNNKLLKGVGAPIPEASPLAVVQHKTVMGSLNSVKTEEELKKWAEKTGATLFNVTEKFDGLSVELVYEQSKLVQASTRGDGFKGESILHSVKCMRNVLQEITGFSGCLRGEIILPIADFDKFFRDSDYSNPRNTAAGIARKKEADERTKHLKLMYFNCINDNKDFPTENKMLEYMESLKVQTPPSKTVPIESVIKLYNFYIEERRAKLPYEIDGLVIKVNETKIQKSLGEHNKRPKGQIAWKFPSMTAETILRDVKAMVGKTGRITPVGHFDKVHVGGVDVEKASLHTYSNLDNLGLFIGGKIIVSRRNDVIPYIEKSSSEPTSMSAYYPVAPKECPSCSTKLIREGEYVLCPNENCPGRRLGDFLKWVEVTEIEEAGPAFLQDVMSTNLFDFDVEDISDLYKLKAEDLMLMEGYKKTKASKIIRNINKKKKLPLETILAGFNIANVGRRVCKKIVEAGFDNLDDLYEVSIEELEKLEGIGSVKAKLFHEGIRNKRKILAKLLRKGVEIMAKKQGKLTGTSFCFTGALSIKRTDAKRMVEDLGGEFKSSVSKGLTYLVQPNATSQTTKARKARDIGTVVIGEDAFMEMVDFEI